MTSDISPGQSERVCLVTGASGTLGTAFCRSDAHEYDIVAVYNSTIPKPALHEGLFTVRADLRRDDEVMCLLEAALARFGRIDIVVNAAACARPYSALDLDAGPQGLTDHWQTNVVAAASVALNAARLFWQDHVTENKSANRNVVNVSSTAGVYVHSGLGHAAYGTSKAALNFLTAHLASELQPLNIRVNAIAPTTFPDRVPTERVVSGVITLAEGDMSGKTLLLDIDEEELI